MAQYPKAFEEAINHAMLYEVGGFWKLTPDVSAGKISTPAQRKAVGYVNDPDDRGGETKFGIAKNANPTLNIATLTWEEAKAIYFKKYWLAGSCDKLPARVSVLHFDGCINNGVRRANIFLQLAAQVTPDGDVGPATIAKVRTLNPVKMCNSICNEREMFYRQIVKNNPVQLKYLNGWLRRITEMRAFTTDLNTFA